MAEILCSTLSVARCGKPTRMLVGQKSVIRGDRGASRGVLNPLATARSRQLNCKTASSTRQNLHSLDYYDYYGFPNRPSIYIDFITIIRYYRYSSYYLRALGLTEFI